MRAGLDGLGLDERPAVAARRSVALERARDEGIREALDARERSPFLVSDPARESVVRDLSGGDGAQKSFRANWAEGVAPGNGHPPTHDGAPANMRPPEECDSSNTRYMRADLVSVTGAGRKTPRATRETG